MNRKFNITLVPAILALCLASGTQAMGSVVLLDNFDTTADPAGINDELTTRQSGSGAPMSYTLEGVNATVSTAEITGGELLITSITQGPKTVYTDWDGSSLAGSQYSVSADFIYQPNTGTLNANTWGSIVINETQSNDVVNTLDLMLLLRANGDWTLYSEGPNVLGTGAIAASDNYSAELAINETGGAATVDLIVDGVTLVDDAAWTPGGASRYTGLRYYGYADTYAMAFDDFTIDSGGVVLHDSFDATADPAGLNDELVIRQSGSEATKTYTFAGAGAPNGGIATAEISGDELLITSNAQGAQTAYLDSDGSGLVGEKYSISADFLFQPNEGSLDANTWGSLVINESLTNDTALSLDLMVLLRANGTWSMYTGGTELDSGTITASDSYHVELAVDETGASSTFDFIVDGTTLVDDGAWTAGGAARYTGMRYYGYSGTYEMAFDNFSITVEGEERIPGDANEDGNVDVTDLGILATNYGAGGGFGWGDGDFTGDGFVDVNDLGILATEYGTTSPTAVPEPGSLALLLVGLVSLALWRRAG